MKPRHQRWRQSQRERLVQIDRREAGFLHSQSQEVVLGDGIGGEAADGAQRFETDDRRRAATERCRPGVFGGHNDIEEESLIVRPDTGHQQIGLDRVRIDEMLRRLDDPDAIVAKQRHRARQKVGRRDEVGVEDRDELRRIRQLRDFP
jgi:hypothetical protein